ncbi:galactose-binding domain-like protein [Radiomyces spectabilis]|uniref:galactose-binding domain-like protein n=1 Tax=Radiomyces spectabilis TaxID=64574 RepID=UPI00221FF6B0|nr:galactose-binding domain-like protein [Radiomyces spectabilis]KAI8384219.1 galactose-binding domain-like protein [Radiomyces spectabilis]
MTSLITPNVRIKVSSVLQRDTVNFGKQNLTDGSNETCWNSEQGLPQYVLIDFGLVVLIQTISLTFQGGFVGKKCVALGSLPESPNEYNIPIGTFYPEDINSTQKFDFESSTPVQRLKLIFEESSDFYGRITIYNLDVFGQ